MEGIKSQKYVYKCIFIRQKWQNLKISYFYTLWNSSNQNMYIVLWAPPFIVSLTFCSIAPTSKFVISIIEVLKYIMQWMFKNMFIVIDSFLKCLMELVGLKKQKKTLKVNLCHDVVINFYYFITIKVFWKVWVLMSVYMYKVWNHSKAT